MYSFIYLHDHMYFYTHMYFLHTKKRSSEDNRLLWWTMTGSNCRHPACKAGALPAELIVHVVTRAGIEPALPPWKGGVLTAWPTGHISQKIRISNWLILIFWCGSSSWARTSDIMINSHALCQLSYRGISLLLSLTFSLNTKDNDFCRYLQHSSFRQLSTFPGSHPPSIIDVKELNFCVRHGNRWFLLAIVTGSSLLRSYPQN